MNHWSVSAEYPNVSEIQLWEKYVIVEELYQGFQKQFSQNGKKAVKEKQREHKEAIEKALSFSPVLPTHLAGIMPLEKSVEILVRIKNRFVQDEKNNGWRDIVKALIHMEINRFFSANQDVYELVIYYMLSRFYKTCTMRSIKIGNR